MGDSTREGVRAETGESSYIRYRPGDRVGSGYGDKIELEAEECKR